MNIIEEIKQDSAGLLFLRDWLGDDGKTVTPDVAEDRAKVCLGCPQNSHPNWWERLLKDPIANAIRRELEIKNKMNIHLHEEENLHMCRICGCATRLKVWAPLAHIKDHTTPQSLEKMPPHCWIKNELANV